MVRVWAITLVISTALVGCTSSLNNSLIKAKLSTPAPNMYPEIVAAFVNQCVKNTKPPSTTRFYKVTKESRSIPSLKVSENPEVIHSCSLETDSYYNDDTVIASLLGKELKRTDTRFTRVAKGGFIGTAWQIGKRKSWSYKDGTPLVSIGRKSKNGILRIVRHGDPL
ncbi:hypothetical protein PsAD2_02601 [Pseudovibrio axinellae]|uniref:Lipoprotein n=1 Tax=Pseudovibrio axinellae TaxID=989403 RepID=A0A165Y3W2_9HYPH|nr:hypothetical protein [Pseudovibrio axinellae]KZL18416.1 hypothetical protein PsAD2_02601 [Pseudovibrio axinellae]SER82539.1 hypothetical protein SAMN05421798_1304 [Pseudovibrio axinellae]